MGAIAELGVPQQGAVAALPVPGATVTPQQADTAAYRATQGPLARGFRSGMNSVGAMLEGLAGQTGEVLGLTDFAQDRFNSAAEYAAMSDAVAPAVRDTSQVKDLNSFVDYVSGHIGSGAATTLPAVAAGVGFRRPVMGVMGMSSAMEAGEQVNTLRADPTVMATQTPEAILANAAKKGVIAGGLEAFGGAGGQAAKTILKGTTAGVGKNLAKGIAGEALTESGQDLTGQVLHQDLNPNKEIDLEQTFQAGAAGAAGGGGIALASQVPGAAMSVAKSGKELADRLRGPSKPRDPYGVPDNIADIKDPEALVKSLEDQENAGFEDLDKELARNPEKYGKYKDWRKNPDQESEFIDAVMEDYAARETRPRTDRAIDEANKLLEDYDRKKYTRVEAQGPETTLNKMGTDVLAGKTIHYNLRDPKVAEFLVQNGYKEDTPGVWTPAKKFSKKVDRTEADDNFHDFMMENITGMTKDRASPKAMLLLSDRLKALALNPRALEASELPAGLRRVIGDRFDKIMTEAINTFHSSEDSKQEALQILADVSQRTKGAVGGRMNAVKALIRTNLRPEYSANKELREAALGTMAERMMNYLENRGDTKSDAGFIEDAKYAFGTEKAAYVIEQLDSLIRKDEQGSYEPTGQERTIDDRLGVPMSDEKALSTFQALKEEFGPKAANLRIVSLGKNRLGNEKFSVEIEDADTVSMTEDAFNAVQESSKYNKSELKDGILTVRTDKHKSGAKVSLVKLTNLMIKKEGQQTQEGGAKYVADMFSRGMSAILSMEGFRGFTQKFEDALGGKPGEKAWTFPDDTLVAVVNGTKYYFKDIKKYELTRMELAGITAEDIKAEMARLRKTPAGQAADPRALRQVAVEIAKEKSRERAMDATLFDNWEVQQETDQTVGSAKTLAERDAPVDEEVGRTSEEDTGLPTQGRSAAAGPRGPAHGQKAPPSVRYVKGESKFIAASSKSGDIVVNLEKAAAEYDAGFPYFLGKEDSPGSKQKGIVAEQLGLTEAKLKELFPTRKDFVAFLRAHEQSHVDNGDAAKYPRTEDGKPDLMHKKAIAIEVRATKDALSRQVEPPAPTPGPGSKRPTLPEPRNSKESLGINKKPRIPGNDNALARAEAALNKESAELMSRVVGPKPNIKFSDLRLNPGEQTEEQRQQVRDYIERVLGKDRTEVLFEKLEGHSGSFEFTADGVERLMITIDTLDPMSVAYHEALHAFFKRLVASDKKAANTLLRAASSAPIVARLKELLKDHPEALKQLADPEERLAYMYQFWAAGHKGLLNVGPETRTFFGAVKSFLRKLSAIWSDEMVENMSVEEAGEILSAFHNGDFMNRSTVAQVLRDKFPESPIESARKIAPWLGRLMDKFIWTSTGAVRDMNIPALTDIMDKFHVQNTAELAGMPGFLQSKNVEFHKRLNKVIMVLKGKTEAQQKEILDELRSGKPRTSAAAQDIENILKEAFQYMKEAGVKTFKRDEDGKLVYIKGGNKPVYEELREIKTNYFPRVPDAEYIRDHKKEFVALLRKYKVHDAEAVYDKYTQDFNMGKPNEEDNVIGLTFYTPQINERSLNNIPDSELAPFMNQDLFGTMAQYLGRATRRAEYTRRFGNAGEVIQDAKEQAQTEGMTKEQARTFDEAVQALEGSLGGDMSPQLKNLYGGLMTYQNIRLLPLALFSSLIDPMGIAVRGGSLTEAFGAFKRGIIDLKSIVTDKAREDDAYMLAQTVGAIDASMDAHMMSDMYGSQYMPKTQQWINSKFFRYNGMESWNRSMRVAATAAAEQFIIRHTTKPNEHSKRYLAELGLSKGDVTIVNDRLVLNKKTEAALNLWVDQAIIRPNAALRPIYMSDPNWMLISHLKQYAYMFQKTIIARVHNEAMHGNFGPAGTMAMYVPIIIASDMLRATLTPGSGDDERMKNWTMADWLWRGVQRAGLFGPGQFVLDSGQDLSMNKLGVESMAGPTVQQLMDFARGTATGSVSNELLKAVPGARVFQ